MPNPIISPELLTSPVGEIDNIEFSERFVLILIELVFKMTERGNSLDECKRVAKQVMTETRNGMRHDA